MKTLALPAAPLALALVLAAALPARAQPAGLEHASVAEIAAQLRSGALTSEALVRFYEDRIARLDRSGPALHAVIAVNPDALAQARALDRERREHGSRGPLHGVPVLIKDNVETADPMPTTAGSLALKDNLTQRDSPLAARLREAGAIILGKTNLSEWANFRSTHATSGWSAVGGLVQNPYALDRTACGSSSGSAAAVAAGFAPAAVGSETDGSITCPASMNGVVGFKPSLGLIPRTHIVPISHSQDTAGPITHTVADAAMLAAVMSGADPGDPASALAPGRLRPVTPATLRGRRLGVLRFQAGAYPEVERLYAAALERLKAAGVVLVEVKLPDPPKLSADENLVLQTEIKTDLAAYLAGAAPGVRIKTLADLIAFNKATPAELHLFDQDILEQSDATKGPNDPAYIAARKESVRLTGPEGIDALLTANHLDALVSPSYAPAWRRDLIYGDNSPAGASTFPAVAGYPHLTVPMGWASRLPVGISFIGAKWRDGEVLALGEAWDALRSPIPAPTFPATVDPEP